MAAGDPVGGTTLFQGVQKNSAAFKLMKQMGWEEGSGLGKNQQGITQHVRVRQKIDNSGVGVAEAKKAASDWTVNTHIFDTILKNLNVKAAGAQEKKEESTSDTSSSDEESDDDEVKQKVEEVVRVKKVARPQGRYQKREAGKAVSLYSSTDLAAILGGVGPAPANDSRDIWKLRKPSTVELETVQIIKSTGAVPIVAKAVSENPVAVTPSLLGRQLTAPKPPAVIPNWWGSQYGFVRGGQLGSQQAPHRVMPGSKGAGKEAIETEGGKEMFNEQDQENLYNLVQDHATTGKRGLGIGDAPKKVAGARWKGSKVTFDSDDENEQPQEAFEAGPSGISEVTLVERPEVISGEGGENAVVNEKREGEANYDTEGLELPNLGSGRVADGQGKEGAKKKKKSRSSSSLVQSSAALGAERVKVGVNDQDSEASCQQREASHSVADENAAGPSLLEAKKRKTLEETVPLIDEPTKKKKKEKVASKSVQIERSLPEDIVNPSQIEKVHSASHQEGHGDMVSVRKGGRKADSGGKYSKGLKWKKLILRVLREGPAEGMKLSKLRKLVLSAATDKLQDGGALQEELSTRFESKVLGSSKFVIDGKLVKIA